jgi:hypothetical protein
MVGSKRSRSGSLKNNPSIPQRSINTGSHTMSKAKTDTKRDDEEVPVMPVPSAVARIAPDYFTVALPYADHYHQTNITAAVAGTQLKFRLNSIFDPAKDEATVHQPLGRDNWSNIYSFYRVMHCEVKLSFINHSYIVTPSAVNGTDTLLFGWEENDQVTTIAANRTAFMESKHSDHRIVPGTGRNVGLANGVTMGYSYSPATWINHIQEAGVDQRWTAVGTSPTNEHLLLVHVFPMDVGTTAQSLDYEITVEMTYTVQFREVTQTLLKTNDGNIDNH